jgi:hypothetical protein
VKKFCAREKNFRKPIVFAEMSGYDARSFARRASTADEAGKDDPDVLGSG